MVHDSTDDPDDTRVRKSRRGTALDAPPQETAPPDLDPATTGGDDEDDALLPDILEESGAVGEEPLASGHEAIERAVRLAPTSPGVYRMLNANADVLYVGKAKNVKKRLSNYARQSAPQPARILRMIAATVTVEIVSTNTETEALLLEANLIKQLRPRFNVQLRDDKSFPYILITGDHWAPQILKHRGAQTRPGRYFGPFASAGAVNRTITALQRAFLIRSCTDSFFESRSRPCLLYQIRRCAGPCTREIDFPGYTTLVREATDFLSGKSHAVKQELAGEMEKAANELEFETAALYRDRLAALSAIQSQQGINPRTVEEADVFAIHQEGGFSCVEVFFFRTGQNWGNRAYFPRAEKTFTPEEVLGSFLAQFYDDKPPPKNILLSHEIEESELLANALSIKAGHKIEVTAPKRGEKKELVAHALTNAREALGRKLADTATQGRLLDAMATTLSLPHAPKRIEVYDNSHIQGTNAVGAMIVAGPDGFVKNQYRKFNIKSEGLTPGDDYGMMREVLERRFKRLINPPEEGAKVKDDDFPQWPDLVIIDGGRGQLNAVREIFANLGLTQVSLMSVAKGPDRDAGRETLFMPEREAIKLEPRDPVLYFIQRLRDEAHRFVIGSHRKLRKKDIREAGLQEIPGIGPSRKRALLHHFGTLKEIERASIADLGKVPGVSAESARRIFEYFHPQPG
ncbi:MULTISPECIES: excinuclease ABC subunit UvrC [Bradyrhizobium]|uniref:UvrABC system protein C n=1 Tax=Bradyrhizobium diazoefficiens (strain JCM 10833 / BCRC 13528 / IAM 13628 / NBRC 14792 / USDA 110) TaxID=224911 RepID=UVRC_BRADU|nr:MULTISPECIES: excinuclease ABC subunit UvrC [Bradyrhizobium]Q89DG9.1 RecName: Full=UvrABC system protein C; Short=Protein UvrC; AltName: Full=Excinuclease ABC subunit C [Bradyrhizobium diazoefficiens USDA 110]MBP1062139.1 excinuclease ABC subunit C [Bradyrhizobium japonicum]AND92422.1 excinuclease ABC subunit C [Bradyrhizobium diazoefficiens USDA 110]AWO94274.1 excinuclease ABC subunit UvrC [Bradyrhizobium diazoefficiens]PDT57689.1 UvrABC system protein C [Bradyrhizobium diazoefficiens]QBP